MVSCAVLILCPLWMHVLVRACEEDELSREVVLSWFREQIMERLGLEEPPLSSVLGLGETVPPEIRYRYKRVPRRRRSAWINRETSLDQNIFQITLFSSSGKKLLNVPSYPNHLFDPYIYISYTSSALFYPLTRENKTLIC